MPKKNVRGLDNPDRRARLEKVKVLVIVYFIKI